MDWRNLADALFPEGHQLQISRQVISGKASVAGRQVCVIGTAGHAEIGADTALVQAGLVLQMLREQSQLPEQLQQPKQALVLLVDTVGQRLRHRDEMLGINSYMAHLGKCLELARQRGHKIVALVYDQALSGGFVTSGMLADQCYALPAARITVMGLAAMARITRVSEARLQELAKTSPVFAPGPENFKKMGGLEALWEGDLAARLAAALNHPEQQDLRMQQGLQRGGRLRAQAVLEAVLADQPEAE